VGKKGKESTPFDLCMPRIIDLKEDSKYPLKDAILPSKGIFF